MVVPTDRAPGSTLTGGRRSSRLTRLGEAVGEAVRRNLMVPSWPHAPKRVRLIALLAARNEMRFLPGFFDSLAGQVDGIVALDDGSTDGTAEYLAARPEVLELIHSPANRTSWDEPGNYRRLLEAAPRHSPEWLVSLDSDERVERGFRGRAERVIRFGSRFGVNAFSVRLYELWDSPDTYRVDGIWGQKRPPRLFRALENHLLDERPLHAFKAPLNAQVFGGFAMADLIIYHLRMIRAEDRLARRERYEQADPEARWQPGLGYEYLTDGTGLRLRRVGRRRSYRTRGRP